MAVLIEEEQAGILFVVIIKSDDIWMTQFQEDFHFAFNDKV